MHGVERISVRVSEFSETLSGGFTKERPGGQTPRKLKLQRSGTSRAVEFLKEWNSQSGGIRRGVELPGGGTPSRVEPPGRVKLGGIQPEWNPQE